MAELNVRDITIKTLKHHNVAFDSLTFKAFWDDGYTIVAVQDFNYSMDMLLGDCFNPAVNTEIAPEQLVKEERAYRRRIRAEGVWGVGLAKDGKPLYGTFVWGNVGDDWIGSGYDAEIIAAMSVRPIEEGR